MGLFNRKKKKETAAPAPAAAPAPEAPVVEPIVVDAPADEAPVGDPIVIDAPAPEAPAQEAPPAPEPTAKELGSVYKVCMNYHAGHDQYNEWPNGGKTIHAGVGWFHPFGVSRYYGMANIGEGWCKEAEGLEPEKFFNEDWMKHYETDLFCIYRLDDGDIYAWDGIFAVRGIDEGRCVGYNSSTTRQDALINVIVGGTGRYEGARGVMVGTAEGGGEAKTVSSMPDGSPLELPATIIKHLEGFIRIPDKAE